MVTELHSRGYLSDWQDEMARLYRKVAGIHTFKSKVHTKLSGQNSLFILSFQKFLYYSSVCHYFTSKVFKTLHFLCFMIITFYFLLCLLLCSPISYLLIHPNSHLTITI